MKDQIIYSVNYLFRGNVPYIKRNNSTVYTYSKLVWSGVKDLFNIFHFYLNTLFTIVWKEQHLKMEKVFQQFRDGDSGVYLNPSLRYLIFTPFWERV
jgi:hypothetical protein